MRAGKYLVLILSMTMIATALVPVGSALSAQHTAIFGLQTVNAASFPASNSSLKPVYKVPVELSNHQSVATGSPYSQEVVVNSAQYSRYEAPDLQNVEWMTFAGRIIPSWIESNDTSSSSATIYWLNMTENISAFSQLVIYLAFVPASTNLFNATGNEGVSPVLTQPYGEYDNGAVVFPVYFNGNTPISDFSVYSGISATKQYMKMPNNNYDYVLNFTGLTGTRTGGWVYQGASLRSGNFMLETMLSTNGCNTESVSMWNTNQVASTDIFSTGVGTGFNSQYAHLSSTYVSGGVWGMDSVSKNAPFPGYGNWVYLGDYTYKGYNYVSSGLNPGSSAVSGISSNDPLSGFSKLYVGAYWPDADSSSMTEYINYVRVSYAPAGGLMPSYDVNATATLTLTESGLPPGSSWYVTNNGHNYTSNYSLIRFSPGFGSVNVSFHARGFHAFPMEKSFNLSASYTSFSIRFSEYPVLRSGNIVSTVYLSNDSISAGSPIFAGRGNGTDSLAFGQSTGFLYATDPSKDRISYFTPTGHIAGNISLGAVPGQMLYDPNNYMIYVAEPYNSSVAILNTLSESLAGTVITGRHPSSLSLDVINNTVYVTNEFSGSISLINASSGTLLNTYAIPMQKPQYILFDPHDGYSYITGNNLTYIGTINSTGAYGQISLATGYSTFPYASLGPVKSILYVSVWDQSSGISTIAGINTTVNTQSTLYMTLANSNEQYGFNSFYDKYNGRMYLSSPRFAGIQVMGSGMSTSSMINATYSDPCPDSMALSTSGSYLYFPETDTNSIAIIDMTRNLVTFTNENYLTGTSWTITVNNTTKTASNMDIQFFLGNGTYSYRAVYSNTTGNNFHQNGNFSLYGYGKSILLPAVPSTLSGTMEIFEVGLPFGHRWNIKIGNISESAFVLDTSLRNVAFPIVLSLPLYASYNYVISSVNYSVVTRFAFLSQEFPGGYNNGDYISSTNALNGAGIFAPDVSFNTFIVFFLPDYYTVTFHETGLDPGTYWDVTVGNASVQSTSSTLNLSLPDGFYSYEIGTTGTDSPSYTALKRLFGYAATPANGSFNFSGSNKTFDVTFSHVGTYHTLNVTFLGFPTDYIYGATLGNRSEYSLGELGNNSTPVNSIHFMATAGSYVLNLSGVPANNNGMEPGRNYDRMSLTVGTTGETVVYRYSPPHGIYTARVSVSGIKAGANIPIDIVGSAPGGAQTMDIIQGDSGNTTLALANGTYTVKYRNAINPDYYFSEQLYWKLLSPTGNNVHFDSQGYMQAQGSLPIEMFYLPHHYLSPHTFTVSGKNITVNLHYQKEYNVTVDLAGVPSNWQVTIGNETFTPVGPVLRIVTVNGTYGYSVTVQRLFYVPPGASDRLIVSPSGGNLSVKGSDVTVPVTTSYAYYVYVRAIMPPGLDSVNLAFDGQNYLVGSSTLIIPTQNGGHPYTIQVQNGFVSSNNGGILLVHSQPAYLNFTVTVLPLSSAISSYVRALEIPMISGIILSAAIMLPLAVKRRSR